MKALFSGLLLLVGTFIFAQENISIPIEIPFTQTANGHIIISATVNDIKGNFIFDTGAGVNLLTKKFADRISDLEETDHFYTGYRATGEALQVELWNSRSLYIGNFEFTKEIFTVYDIDIPLDGLISLTPFKNTPFTIDFENKIFRIETDQSLEQLITEKDFEMPIQISNDRDIKITMATAIQVEGAFDINVNLDSGAGFDVYRFSSRYIKNLGLDKANMENEYKSSMFKPEQGNQYFYTSLSKMSDKNGNVFIRDFKATFIEGLIHEGIMSINWIGDTFTVDIPNKRLYVQK